MFLGIDSSEFMLIGVLALVLIGPKDLPRVMHQIGKWIARTRATAGHFRAGLDEVVRQAQVATDGMPNVKVPTSAAKVITLIATVDTRRREPGGEESNVVPLKPALLAQSFAPPSPPAPIGIHTAPYDDPDHDTRMSLPLGPEPAKPLGIADAPPPPTPASIPELHVVPEQYAA